MQYLSNAQMKALKKANTMSDANNTTVVKLDQSNEMSIAKTTSVYDESCQSNTPTENSDPILSLSSTYGGVSFTESPSLNTFIKKASTEQSVHVSATADENELQNDDYEDFFTVISNAKQNSTVSSDKIWGLYVNTPKS
jgi:hypothetical protein